MAAKKYVQTLTQYLAGSGVIVGATSIVLTSFTDIYGNALALADFGDKGYGSLEPDTTNEEAFTFTGVTVNANGTVTLTGVSTALAKSPYTETSGLVRAHSGGTKLVISDSVAFWNTFANKNNNETIAGKYTFPNANRPTMDTDADSATATDLVTVGQLSRQAISGASNASTSVKGIVQIATQAQVDARTTTGSTAALLVPSQDLVRSTQLSDYVASDTGSANAYAIAPTPAITAYAAGQTFSFKPANTNTLTSTINVNAVGVKTIQRGGSNLGAGDLIAGQIYEIKYDGTNFQLLTPINSTPSGSMQMYAGSTAPTSWLLCDGASYLQATYPVLFAIIGTTYGSADGSHFNVPDMRGRVPVGVGTGTGGGAAGTGLPAGGSALTVVARAGWKGEETHILTTPEMPAHTHTVPISSVGGGAIAVTTTGGAANQNTGSTGGDGAHNNIQPIMGVNFIIKT